MSNVKTRRQVTVASTPTTPTPKPVVAHTAMNGNGSAHGHVTDVEAYPKENIFIFIPNLIGKLQPNSSKSPTTKPHVRIFTDRTSHSIPILHAPSSTNLFPPLQHILSPRRTRRLRSTSFRAINSIRCRPRHGNRPLHNSLPSRLFSIRLPKMVSCFPRPDLARPGKPLYAYVCHTRHGRG